MTTGRLTPTECLHYAMNLPVSVVITGCDTLGVLKQALNAVYRFTGGLSEARTQPHADGYQCVPPKSFEPAREARGALA